MDKLKDIKMVVIKLLKQKLKLESCKNNLNNLSQNLKSLQFKIKNFLLIFKKIKKKLMLKELFVSKKKSNVTFREMKPIS